jgi:hypothetical protein
MQTFLPYADFYETAKCLDWRRLGNQRNEANIILKTIRGESDGWKHHPIVKMWTGYEEYLEWYRNVMIEEWIRRGYSNHMKICGTMFVGDKCSFVPKPPWLGNEEFHSSHRAALLFKNYDHYKQFSWNEVPKMEYVWL